jgi:3-oxoadipate enol-lactonase
MFALIDGLEIAYDDVGSGPPIVFVHGFPHDRTLWTPQIGALVDHARCIAPDLRGFGETAPAPPYSMDQYADDIAALLAHLRIDRVVFAGLSMGGYIAFAFWRRHRKRVRGLILADTRAGADSSEARAKRQELIKVARERGSIAVADAMLPGMIGKTTREKNPLAVEIVRDMLQRATVDGTVGALQALMERPDSTPTLATIDVPTLIVVGEEDALTPPKESRTMHEAISGSRLEVLARAGHVSNIERTSAFNHVVGEFLASVELV